MRKYKKTDMCNNMIYDMLYILCCIIALLLKYFKPKYEKACGQYPFHPLQDGPVLPAGLLRFLYSVSVPGRVSRIRARRHVICPMAS